MPAAPPSIFADPLRNQRMSMDALLDTMNCQGPKPVALLKRIVEAAAAEPQPYSAGAVNRISGVALQAIAEQVPDKVDEPHEIAMVKSHIHEALPGLSAPLLEKLRSEVAQLEKVLESDHPNPNPNPPPNPNPNPNPRSWRVTSPVRST